MTKENGGPAFPQNELLKAYGIGVIDPATAGGMSLRDYFAAIAIPAVTADMQITAPKGASAFEIAGAVAKTAYLIADAMLEARK